MIFHSYVSLPKGNKLQQAKMRRPSPLHPPNAPHLPRWTAAAACSTRSWRCSARAAAPRPRPRARPPQHRSRPVGHAWRCQRLRPGLGFGSWWMVDGWWVVVFGPLGPFPQDIHSISQWLNHGKPNGQSQQPCLRSLSQLEYSQEETPIWDCLLISGFTSKVEVCMLGQKFVFLRCVEDFGGRTVSPIEKSCGFCCKKITGGITPTYTNHYGDVLWGIKMYNGPSSWSRFAWLLCGCMWLLARSQRINYLGPT